MKCGKTLAAAITAAAIALPLIASADNDRCKKVRFKVTNNHSTERAIQLTGVEYEDIVNSKKVSRQRTPVDCAYRATSRVTTSRTSALFTSTARKTMTGATTRGQRRLERSTRTAARIESTGLARVAS